MYHVCLKAKVRIGAREIRVVFFFRGFVMGVGMSLGVGATVSVRL